MTKLQEALAALPEIKERAERIDKRGYCCMNCEMLCGPCEDDIPLLVAAVEEAGHDRNEIGRLEAVIHETGELADMRGAQRDQATARAEAAEAKLREAAHARETANTRARADAELKAGMLDEIQRLKDRLGDKDKRCDKCGLGLFQVEVCAACDGKLVPEAQVKELRELLKVNARRAHWWSWRPN